MKMLLSSVLFVSAGISSAAFAESYRCQADLVTGRGQIAVSIVGEGFSRQQACYNALDQCDNDLLTFQQQGQYRDATCRLRGQDNPGGPTPFPPTNPGNDRYQQIPCSSYNNQVNYCFVGDYAYSIQLLRQFSSASCRYGYSYGLTGQHVWVADGCRGEFGVYSRY